MINRVFDPSEMSDGLRMLIYRYWMCITFRYTFHNKERNHALI
jgi:hypothetical protein